MRLRKLIKEFWFRDEDRAITTLGPDVRIVPERDLLTLKATGGAFPTTQNLYAKTRLTNPLSVKKWIGFQVDVTNDFNAQGVALTSVKYRLSDDGTNQLWWNGSAWVAAAPGEWNTEAEVANNIASFPVTNRSLQVIVNPSTTVTSSAPEVTRIKVLYDSDLEWDEEYIGRSLLPALREEIRPIGEYTLVAPSGGLSTVDLGAIETPYNIDSVDSAFNLATDPDRLVDIADTYDAGAKVLTLATPAAAGESVNVRFVYVPEVVLARSQDYTELSKVPALVIESVVYGDSQEVTVGEHVINKATGAGWQQDVGAQYDINISLRWVADKQVDAVRIANQAKKFFDERMLRARGQDELFPLCIVDAYDSQTSAGQSGLHTGRLRARLYRAVFYVQPAKPVRGVLRLLATANSDQFNVASSGMFVVNQSGRRWVNQFGQSWRRV